MNGTWDPHTYLHLKTIQYNTRIQFKCHFQRFKGKTWAPLVKSIWAIFEMKHPVQTRDLHSTPRLEMLTINTLKTVKTTK